MANETGDRLEKADAAEQLRLTARLLETRRQLSKLPWANLSWLIGSRKARISLTVQAYEEGMLPTYDAVVLISALVAEAPLSVLEIGTFMGHTTRRMAENLPGSVIHTLDLPPDVGADAASRTSLPIDDVHLIASRDVGREFRDWVGPARIVQHFGDSASWDFTPVGRPDFFFVDGAHTYEYCRSDSEKCLELSEGRGVFFWHDCDETHPGVVRLLSEWHGMGRNIVRINGTSLAYWKLAPEAAE